MVIVLVVLGLVCCDYGRRTRGGEWEGKREFQGGGRRVTVDINVILKEPMRIRGSLECSASAR